MRALTGMTLLASPEPRAETAAAIVGNLTLTEQLGLLHGSCVTGLHIGSVCGVSRHHIPGLTLSDGPQGLVAETFATARVARVGTSTAWPSALALAATWDTQAVSSWADALGREFRQSGTNMALGPGLNVARVPLSGRVFESLSGEDPYLGAELAGPAVAGIQRHGVIATAKHFALNDQELDRGTVSAVADERTRFEMHYPPFEAAVKAGVGAVMCAYNKLSIDSGAHTWACENPELLRRDLKTRMGFKGFVVSDWEATHSLAIDAGLDMEMDEMGEPHWYGERLAAAVADGSVSAASVRRAAQRVLEPVVRLGLRDRKGEGGGRNVAVEAERVVQSAAPPNVTGAAHAQLAVELATQTIVLLKNDAAGEEGSKGDHRGKRGNRRNGGKGGRRGNWGNRGGGAALYAPSRPTPHAPAPSPEPEPGWDEPGWDWGGAAEEPEAEEPEAAPEAVPESATNSATEKTAKKATKDQPEGGATTPPPALPLLPLDPKAYSKARPLRLLLVGQEVPLTVALALALALIPTPTLTRAPALTQNPNPNQAAAPTVLGGGSGSVVPASVSSPLAALRSHLGLPPLPSPPSKCAQKLQHSPQLRTRRPPPPSHKPHRGRGRREAANATVGPGGRRALRRRFQAEQDERSLSAAAPNLHACCEQCAARNPSPGPVANNLHCPGVSQP